MSEDQATIGGSCSTVTELIQRLQQLVEIKPDLADHAVDVEGCDCWGPLGALEVTFYTDSSVGILLARPGRTSTEEPPSEAAQ